MAKMNKRVIHFKRAAEEYVDCLTPEQFGLAKFVMCIEQGGLNLSKGLSLSPYVKKRSSLRKPRTAHTLLSPFFLTHISPRISQ